MPALSEKLLDPAVRPQVVTDCEKLVDEEVASKGGLAGMAIKGAYAVVKAVKSGIVREVLESLLPEFAQKLDPFHDAWAPGRAGPFSAYLQARAGEVSEALLAITDARAQQTKNSSLRKAYEKLRPTGKKNVEQAVPRLGLLLDRYCQPAGRTP